MNAKTEGLVAQLLEISPEERQEVFLVLFGSGLLPEAAAQQEAEAAAEEEVVRYKVQGAYVDQRTYEFMQGVNGIFSAEQFGMNINDAADAYDALASARRAEANVKAVIGGGDYAWKAIRKLQNELFKVGCFLGIARAPHQPTFSAEEIIRAIGPREVMAPRDPQ